MNRGRQYIRKVIRMRLYLMQEGKSQRDPVMCNRIIKELTRWLNFYTRATEQQVAKFLLRNEEAILQILPGKGNPSRESLLRELNQIIYGDYNNQKRTTRNHLRVPGATQPGALQHH